MPPRAVAKFKHEPVTGIHGSKDDLIDSFLVDEIPLDSVRTFKDLSDDGSVAGLVSAGRPVLMMKL